MHPISLITAILASTLLVAGHGQVNRVTHGSTSNPGPNIYYAQDAVNSKTAVRVMYQASSPSYVLFGGFTDNSQMSCEGSAKSPAPETISVNAGDEIDIFWEGATGELKGKPGTGGLSAYNPWVHAMGFVFDYITSCNGDCTTFDATNAGWTKLAHAGMDMSQSISSGLRATMQGKPEPYHPSSGPGLWAMAKLVQDGSKWTVKIPSSLKTGQYMIRHELAAVHNPKDLKTNNPTTGPQLYIACIQLDVKNGGDTSLPAGTQAKSLYSPTGDFANINVNSGSFDPSKVTIPGPPVWDGVSSSSNGSGDNRDATSTHAGTTTSKAAATTKAATPTKSTSGPAATTAKACRRRQGITKRAKRSHNEPLRRMIRNRLS